MSKVNSRRSIRFDGYDYSQEGAYYITICTQDKIRRFGHIENDVMVLNEYGKIAHEEWVNTGIMRKNVQLGDFVIMPNHIHGIIIIRIKDDSNNESVYDADKGVCKTPLQNLGSIVRGFKSAVTRRLNESGFNGKLWQRNYYEHIIRDGSDYARIADYIQNNPMNWQQDEYL